MISRSATSHRRRAVTSIAATIALLTVLVPAIAIGHAVVYPKASTPGAYERYVLRVPNEKTVATTRVELRFPADVRVTSFSDVAGWQLEVLTDSAKQIIGAVWTGSLPPQRFVEFPFVAVNPKTPTKLLWPAYQTYADGERVMWTGAEGEKSPASVTTVALPAAANDSTMTRAAGAPMWVPWTALVLALVSLGLVLRRRE